MAVCEQTDGLKYLLCGTAAVRPPIGVGVTSMANKGQHLVNFSVVPWRLQAPKVHRPLNAVGGLRTTTNATLEKQEIQHDEQRNGRRQEEHI